MNVWSRDLWDCSRFAIDLDLCCGTKNGFVLKKVCMVWGLFAQLFCLYNFFVFYAIFCTISAKLYAKYCGWNNWIVYTMLLLLTKLFLQYCCCLGNWFFEPFLYDIFDAMLFINIIVLKTNISISLYNIVCNILSIACTIVVFNIADRTLFFNIFYRIVLIPSRFSMFRIQYRSPELLIQYCFSAFIIQYCFQHLLYNIIFNIAYIQFRFQHFSYNIVLNLLMQYYFQLL